MKISVFGVGYVGAVSAACLARDGHSVVGVDVDSEKVVALARGHSPIKEPGLDAIISDAVSQHRLTATTDAADAVANSEMSYVCVGTPTGINGQPDLTHVQRVAEQIGSALARKRSHHSVVVRSTVLPGTMDNLVIPTLEKRSGRRADIDFGTAFFPEFLREGSAVTDYDNPGAMFFGVRDDITRRQLTALHAHLGIEPRVLEMRAAETIKFANNAWHALKISFANEIGLICKAFDVDSHEVMDGLCQDRKLNISPAYLKPGFAFGGSCLPKDLRALRFAARRVDVDTPLLDATLKANENQFSSAFQLIEATGRRKIGIVGLSFKPLTDDLRSSPFVDLAERLIGRGYAVSIFDPIVRMSSLTGSNRDYVTKHLPHICNLLMEDRDDLLARSEVLVIGNASEARSLLERPSASGKIVVDLVRIDQSRLSGGDYHGICW